MSEQLRRRTERRPHLSRRPGTYLAKVLCLLVERTELRSHELGLNFDDVFEILGLADFLYEPKSTTGIFGRVAQKRFSQFRVTPRRC